MTDVRCESPVSCQKVSIEISVRTPDGKRFIVKSHSTADCTQIIQSIESEGFSISQYELVRAYPREKLELSAGISLEDLGIKNQDAFHLQLKM